MPSKNASLEFVSLTLLARRINHPRLQLHLVPQINALIPRVILAPQVLSEFQPQQSQPHPLISVSPQAPAPQVPTFKYIVSKKNVPNCIPNQLRRCLKRGTWLYTHEQRKLPKWTQPKHTFFGETSMSVPAACVLLKRWLYQTFSEKR